MESVPTPERQGEPSGYRGCGLFLVLGLLVLALGAWWLLGHDFATKAVSVKAGRMKWDQWKQVYDQARPIFAQHDEELKTKERVLLKPDEVPAMIRDLGYEEFFVTSEGVTYQRVGGGADIFFTAIHCVFVPQSRAYTHKGIWFIAPEVREWTYVAE